MAKDLGTPKWCFNLGINLVCNLLSDQEKRKQDTVRFRAVCKGNVKELSPGDAWCWRPVV